MAEVSAHLTDKVIPHLPVRRWELSVPKRLRPFLHQTPGVASAALAIFLRALRAASRDASPGAPVPAARSHLLPPVLRARREGNAREVLNNMWVPSDGRDRMPGYRLREGCRYEVRRISRTEV